MFGGEQSSSAVKLGREGGDATVRLGGGAGAIAATGDQQNQNYVDERTASSLALLVVHEFSANS